MGVDDSQELEPQTGARALKPCALSGRADVLARKATAYEFGALEIGAHVAHVCNAWNARPVAGEHRPRERVGLALPHSVPEPGPFKP